MVGWHNSPASMGVNWLLDLGASQPIGRVVVRFLAGAEQGRLKCPAKIVLAASEDGRTFSTRSGSLEKLQPAEKELDGRAACSFCRKRAGHTRIRSCSTS